MIIQKRLFQYSKGLLFLVVLFLIGSCRVNDISGQYITCPWNCNTLSISNDNTYMIKIRPEIGSKFYVNGTWNRNGNQLILQPIIEDHLYFDSINSYWLVEIDGVHVIGNVFTEQVDTLTYLIKRNILTEPSSRKCWYHKLSSDSTEHGKVIAKNRRRCFR